MIVNVFYLVINGLSGLVPDPPSPPSWWPTGGLTIPLQGIASAGVVTAVLVTYLAILLLSSVAFGARRILSLVSLGGGSL